tara:strand:- start:43 stop:249 length:207 start_codon:yes stop_codon:yes gene_type:complete
MSCVDHETHLQNLVNQANTLSNEIESRKIMLMKVQGVIEYLSEIGVELPKQEAPVESEETPSEPEVSE